MTDDLFERLAHACDRCKYYVRGVECPWPICREDCLNESRFFGPMRRRLIREAMKIFPSLGVVRHVTRSSESTVFRALQEHCMYSLANHVTCKDCPIPCDYREA